ncbi:succinylglutamate desuccinylase [Marinomonas sp. 2405UD68-3]|uniref:succinylglutamate desuccinylase n=1 Tax=Marinomonas sp. 2405UD68-3 TaxID=3391835 RepID=UPI0039C9FB32
MPSLFSFQNGDFLAYTLANPVECEPQSFQIQGADLYLEDTGILRIEPSQPTSISLVISVGIHGNETGPIELINNLLKDIFSGELILNVRLLVLIGNPVSSNAGKRFIDVNMNRLFSGAWKTFDCPEAKRAENLENVVQRFYEKGSESDVRLHYDLHTAIRGSEYEQFAVYPFDHGSGYSKSQLNFLAASGLDAVLLSHQPTTTFSYYTHLTYGAHAFTVELGKVYPFGQNDLSRFSGIDSSLRSLMATSEIPQGNLSSLTVFAVKDALIKDAEDYTLNIGSDVKNFTGFDKGFCLAQSSLSEYRVALDGDAIIFPNAQVPVGQRTGLIVRLTQPETLLFIKE